MSRPLMFMVMYLFWWAFQRKSLIESTELRQSFSKPEAGKAIAMTLGVMQLRSRLQPNSLNLFFGPATSSLRKSIIITISAVLPHHPIPYNIRFSLLRMLSTGMGSLGDRYRASRTLELPKISRTFACSQYRSSLPLPCTARELDYSLLSAHQIQHQYNILRQQLVDLNGFMARKVEPLKYMPMRKSHQLQAQLSKEQVSQQELRNNQAILQRLHLELSSLQDRLQEISLVGKGEIDQQIQKARKDIKGAKVSIKEMELGVYQKGRSIQSNDQVFEAIAFLEREKSRLEMKRRKMEQHSQKVLSQTQTLRDKIASIANEAASAQSMSVNFDQTLKKEAAQEVKSGKLSQKQQEKRALQKNIDSLRSMKEHQFRNLNEKERTIRESLFEQESRIQKSQGILQIRKKQLQQLQGKLHQLMENKHLGSDKAQIFNSFAEQQKSKTQSISPKKETSVKKPEQIKKSLQIKSIRQQNKTISVVPPKSTISYMKNGSSELNKKSEQSSNFDLIPLQIPSIEPSKNHDKELKKKTDDSKTANNKLEKQKTKNKFINVQNQKKQEVLPGKKKQQGKIESKTTEKKQESREEIKLLIQKKQEEEEVKNYIESNKGGQISKEGKEQEKKEKEPQEREESQYQEDESQFEDIISSSQQSEEKQKEDAQFEQKVLEQRQKMSRGVKTEMEMEGIKQLASGEGRVRKNHFTIEL